MSLKKNPNNYYAKYSGTCIAMLIFYFLFIQKVDSGGLL